jgi:thiol peroxidase
MKGNPLTLVGPVLKIGDNAPDFTLIGVDLKPVSLHDSKGRVRLLSVVTSLDTGICNTQTCTLDARIPDVGGEHIHYTISADLPFAQSRFAKEHSIKNITFLSDHREMAFAKAYGVLVKELRLIARSVWVIDRNDRISYVQILPEIATEPNYDEALKALKEAAA